MQFPDSGKGKGNPKRWNEIKDKNKSEESGSEGGESEGSDSSESEGKSEENEDQ